MSLLEMAYVPPARVSPEDTVCDAVEAAMPASCDAVAVLDGERVVGILTSRDIMLKVVLPHLDSGATRVGEVMTSPVITLGPDTPPEDALQLMLERHIRHLLVCDDGGAPLGMVSLRKLLNWVVQDQRESLAHMEAFLTADSIGG